jgi:putative chitinase
MKKVSLGFTLVAVLALLAVQLGLGTAPVSAAPSSHTRIHVVQWGENLFRIAIRYGTTVEAIANANGIVNPHRIYAGQRLTIPYGHSPGSGFWYTVQWGDTLSGLAWRFGRNMWSIYHANAGRISNPNWIYAGQKIYIP